MTNATVTEIDNLNKDVPMNKEALKKLMRPYMAAKIYPVSNIAPLDRFYIKQFNVREMTNYFQRTTEFTENNADGLANIREKALMIVDSAGNPIFNPDDREDMEFLANLPITLMNQIVSSFWSVNGDDGLKKLLAAKNS